jgi:hypothetical protein
MAHPFHLLRRLRRHAEASMLRERVDVSVIEHDVEIRRIEIAGEAAHLDVIPLPDDHHVIALTREHSDRTDAPRARADTWPRPR